MRPHCLSPGVPLVLPSLNVALLDTMWNGGMVSDPVMQDATSKNKLHLSWVSVEWFLIKDFKPIFQGRKALSKVTLRLECLRLKSSSTFSGLFLEENSFRYLVFLKGGGFLADKHNLHL
jgi:hypothetical protein